MKKTIIAALIFNMGASVSVASFAGTVTQQTALEHAKTSIAKLKKSLDSVDSKLTGFNDEIKTQKLKAISEAVQNGDASALKNYQDFQFIATREAQLKQDKDNIQDLLQKALDAWAQVSTCENDYCIADVENNLHDVDKQFDKTEKQVTDTLNKTPKPAPVTTAKDDKNKLLLDLLAKFPDTSFTGTSKTAKLSAGTSGSNASVTYGLESTSTGDNLFSFSLSAPTSKSGDSTAIYDHADGFTNMTNIKLSDTFTHGVFKFGKNAQTGGDDYALNFVGGTLKAGYQQHQYYTLDDPGSQKTSTLWAGGLGLYDGIAWDDDHNNLRSLTFSASWQQNEKDQKSQTVCPLPATGHNTVSCTTGSINAPSESTGWLLSLAYRNAFNNGYAATGTLSYNTSTKVSEFDLPLYVIQGSDKSDKSGSGPLNGGIDVNWTSDKHWNIGVFVGVPLSLIGDN